jgi:hypothetical protein
LLQDGGSKRRVSSELERKTRFEEASVGVLYPTTFIGGTRWRVDGGGSPDLKLEGVRKDTRHKIYTGSGSQRSVPYVLFRVLLRPALRCCSPEGLWMFD